MSNSKSKPSVRPAGKSGAAPSPRPPKQPLQPSQLLPQQPVGLPPELPQPSTDSANPAPDSSASQRPGDVGLDVRPPEPGKGSGFLSGLLSASEDGAAPTAPRKRGRPPKVKPSTFKVDADELANLLLVPLLLLAVKRWMPEALWPEPQEASGFCAHAARIIARHLPGIPASEDAIDLGQMVLIAIGYFMRIQPILAELRKQPAAQKAPVTSAAPAVAPEEPDNGREITVELGLPGRVGLRAGSG